MAQSFDLVKASQAIKKSGTVPPVDQWNPDFCGDIDMQIKRDGRWFYGGTPIGRASMVSLFAKVLWMEAGQYFLKTPVEKVGIQVEDAPFLFTQMEVQTNTSGEVEIVMTSLTEDEITVGPEHPLWVEVDDSTGEPSPYVEVRFGMKGLIHRNVFYQLVEMAETQTTSDGEVLVVQSQGETFTLGNF